MLYGGRYRKSQGEWYNSADHRDAADIMDKVGHCPFCTLTVLRLAGLLKWPYVIKFDLKEELKEWWSEKEWQSEEEEENYY